MRGKGQNWAARRSVYTVDFPKKNEVKIIFHCRDVILKLDVSVTFLPYKIQEPEILSYHLKSL